VLWVYNPRNVNTDFFPRPVTLEDVQYVQGLYQRSKRYFDIIAADIPNQFDVSRELESALGDARRYLELYFKDNNPEPFGYLDLKFDYPKPGDATINLLLIAQDVQSSGFGTSIVTNLEQRLNAGAFAPRRVRRVLAGIYGENPGAVKFWERLGYHFAVDARPVLAWYAKELVPSTLEVSR
jgi:ribosomal protein S18 acetylase RimI-like enzyme